jgi:flagellar L-ring protein precursor FlgH
MTNHANNAVARAVFAVACLASLPACNVLNKLSEVGEPPRTSSISNPTEHPQYKPVSMPMPAPKTPETTVNSLWRPGARAFFKDQRAKDVGDIMTVAVSIADTASLSNKTEATRDNNESTDANFVMLGLEQRLSRILPKEASPASLAAFGSSNKVKGDGTVDRGETISVTMAATIIQVLPNGNLVISGRQEVRVNGEMRELAIRGVIRPEDITSKNTISSDKIAEARIIYGGRGTLSDVQMPRYGQQIFDIVFPF